MAATPRDNQMKTKSNQSHKVMTAEAPQKLKDGDLCRVVGGTHIGKTGTVSDINTSKTGHLTLTMTQENGVRFKTLARNVVVQPTRPIRKGSKTQA